MVHPWSLIWNIIIPWRFVWKIMTSFPKSWVVMAVGEPAVFNLRKGVPSYLPGNFSTYLQFEKALLGQGWFQGPPLMGPSYGKLPILFPYHSHIFTNSYGNSMGKGSQYWGVPENSIDLGGDRKHFSEGSTSFWRGKNPMNIPRWMYQWLKRCRARSGVLFVWGGTFCGCSF